MFIDWNQPPTSMLSSVMYRLRTMLSYFIWPGRWCTNRPLPPSW
jgi:hypothetical protein